MMNKLMVGGMEFHKHKFKFYSLKWFITQQTMCNPNLLCLPPIANTFRDLDMRFTWVIKGVLANSVVFAMVSKQGGDS